MASARSAGGMRRLGYEIEMKQFPMAWRVNFRVRGGEHVLGSAWEPTAWRAVQRAAWAALAKHRELRLQPRATRRS